MRLINGYPTARAGGSHTASVPLDPQSNSKIERFIGELQRGGKRFFSSLTTPDLGVHVPTVAVLLDFFGGWRRPCDGEPYQLSSTSLPRNWGVIPWDNADFAVDYVFETIYPGG